MVAVRRLSTGHWLLLLVAVGAVVRFATLASQDFWFDEFLTTELIKLDPGQILPRISIAETNPPLYYVLAAGWERVFGDGEVALRSLSAWFGTATIPVVYAAGRELVSERTGLAAAALTATSPILIWYSQEARSYSLLVLLASLSFLCFAHLLRPGSPRWLLGWVIFSALAISTHYLAGLLVAFEAGWLLWQRRDMRGDVALASGAIAVTALVLAPLAATQQSHGDWIAFVDFSERLVALPQHLVVGLSTPSAAFAPIALAALAVGAGYGLVRMSGEARRPVLVAAGAVAVGLAITLLAAAADSDYLITRNLLALWAPLAITVGALLAEPAASWVGPAVLAFLCALGLGLAVWNAATPAAGRPDWEGVVAGLGAADEPRLVVTQPLAASLGAHLDGSRVVAPGESLSTREIDVVDLRPVTDYSIGPCWWTGFCGGRQILGDNALPLAVPPQFELVAEGSTDLFTYRRYRAPTPLPVPGPTGTDGVFLQAPP